MLKALTLPFGSVRSSKPASSIQSIKARTKPAARSHTRPAPWQTTVAYVLIGLNAVLLMAYIAGVNGSASKGYEIKSIQNKIAVLNETNRKLNLKISEQSSLASLQAGTSSQFVPVGSGKFLQVNQYTQK